MTFTMTLGSDGIWIVPWAATLSEAAAEVSGKARISWIRRGKKWVVEEGKR